MTNHTIGKLDTICTESEVSCRKSAYHMGIGAVEQRGTAPRAGCSPPFLEMRARGARESQASPPQTVSPLPLFGFPGRM